MNTNKSIETIGSITKIEHLNSIIDLCLPNTLVLRSVNPFPGVVRDKENNEQSSYFIILRYRYAPEKINRINSMMHSDLKIEHFPGYGEIVAGKTIMPCIRLKKIEAIQIKTIQQYLKANNLKLGSFKPIDKTCRIKIFKSFKLTELAEYLYRDLCDSRKFYLHTGETLNWKRFEYITKKIKSKLEVANFDAALGVIYRFDGPQNVIRIYDNDKSLNRALQLKKLYFNEVKNELLISAI